MTNPNHETIEGVIIRTTDRAILLRLESNDEEVWIPRSVCINGDVLDEGDTDPDVEEWFVRKENLT